MSKQKNWKRNVLYAKCIDICDPYSEKPDDNLVKDNFYEVKSVHMGQSHTSIYLKDIPKMPYNSVQFDFYLNGREHDIYEDPDYNPYLYDDY